MAEKLSMADLLARNIAIDWFEAVALVREVCAVLMMERVEESTPDLAQILLGSNGKITITGTAHGDAPVRRLGQLLQALLRTSEPPVTLRLVLSEAMAAPPVYATVAELDGALAYFERPDRYVVLKALYDRAAAAEAIPTEATSVQDLDHIAPLPAAQQEVKKKKRHRGEDRRAIVLVVATAALITVVVAAYQRGMLFGNSSWRIAGARASAAVDKAVISTMSAATEMAGMGKLVESGSPTPEVAAEDLQVPGVARRRPARPTPVMLAGVSLKLFDLQPTTDVAPAVELPAKDTPQVLEASAPRVTVDQRVYGPEDHDVSAPLAIRPHLPTSLPEGVSASELARIELVVAPDGEVESVKLLPGRAPTSVSEAMLLSAAKAWRFSPALKAGHSVRYRKTVFLSER